LYAANSGLAGDLISSCTGLAAFESIVCGKRWPHLCQVCCGPGLPDLWWVLGPRGLPGL